MPDILLSVCVELAHRLLLEELGGGLWRSAACVAAVHCNCESESASGAVIVHVIEAKLERRSDFTLLY